MNRKTMVSLVAGILAAIMILGLVLAIFPAVAHASKSSDLKKELEALKEKAADIKAERKELKKQQAANTDATKDLVEQKLEIEDEIKLIHDEIDNINLQIQAYSSLIAEKQKELDDARYEQELLSHRYKGRIRAMEKSDNISYWSVLFRSKSVAEFLSTIRMMNDIARADEAMMAELQAAADLIAQAQEELTLEKQGLNEQRVILAQTQQELDAKNAEAALLLDELNDEAFRLAELDDKYHALEAEASKDIAKKEKEYNDAVKEENAGSGGGGSGYVPDVGDWGYPLPYRCRITSPYGYRYHPTTGKYSFHTGVDFGVSSGVKILSMRGGTVTTSGRTSVWGNYVVVNHGDGYSSLYAHMSKRAVSVGDTVSKGQVLGYVGSTGYSTGPHLHLTIYYNGNHVNPAKFLD